MFSLNMLPTLPVHNHNQKYHHYITHAPSPLSSSPLRASPDYTPLSPRNSNARSPFPMSSQTPSKPPRSTSPTSTSVSRSSDFSKRLTKSNPLLHNRGDGRETRRKLFLKKVREDGEEKRWKARGGDDEMMRTIWLAEQRRVQESRAMDPEAETFGEEDLDGAQSLDEIMADEVAKMEDEELEALLSSMEEPQSEEMDDSSLPWMDRKEFGNREQRDVPPSDTPYGSDDDDYDHIFLDVIEEEKRRTGSQQEYSGDVEMDLS